MAGRGGKAPQRKGDAFEVKVVKNQQSLGRSAYRVRQGQGAIVDVVSVVSLEACQDGHCTVNGSRVGHARLIQCRSDGPRLSVGGRGRLRVEADEVDGIPLLAWAERGLIRYEALGDDD